MEELINLSSLIKKKNDIDSKITSITRRPALIGHTGEYIASEIFRISLMQSAAHKGIDGYFLDGNLKGRSVNIKWYGKMENILDITPKSLPDYYLVMTGPKTQAVSSRGKTRPWVIEFVFLFDALKLMSSLSERNIRVGVATSVTCLLWEKAMIYPVQDNQDLVLDEAQIRSLQLFKD